MGKDARSLKLEAQAALLFGVSRQAVRNWLKRSRAGGRVEFLSVDLPGGSLPCRSLERRQVRNACPPEFTRFSGPRRRQVGLGCERRRASLRPRSRASWRGTTPNATTRRLATSRLMMYTSVGEKRSSAGEAS